MPIELEQAGPLDVELLVDWRLTVLREVFAIPEGEPLDALAQANRRYYQRALANGEHIACFARMGQAIAGCGGICLYQELPSPDNPSGGCAYLMNIYTCPDFRGQGVGRAVVGWLIGQARERGITKIYLETSAAGRPLYQKMGFTDMAGLMQLTSKEPD